MVCDQIKGVLILGHALGALVHPTVEKGFEFLLLGLNFKRLRPWLADVVLPVVGGLGVLGGVLMRTALSASMWFFIVLSFLEATTLDDRRVVEVDGLPTPQLLRKRSVLPG